jgi:hypothetical protein
LGSLPSAILWTWPYHVSWFCSISFIIVSSSPICCLIVIFLFLRYVYEISCESNVQWQDVSGGWLYAGEFEFNLSRDNNFYPHYHFQTASGAHTASMKWTLEGFSPGVK